MVQCTMIAHMADTDLLTTSEASAILGGVDRSTISRWATLGKITPAKKLPGRNGALLFRRADVERLAADLKVKVSA